jgi:hypothetical protein
MILSSTLSGCAFGTNRVTLSPIAASVAPMDGPRIDVRTRDARTEVSGATVGFKRNGYGAKTGDVQLANNEPLSERLGSDVVSILRERGYRADTNNVSGELHCDVEILSFLVDVKQGVWTGTVEGIAAARIRIADQVSGREIWNDIVRADSNKKGVQFVSGGDHQEVVERLYSNLISNIRAAIPDRRRPAGQSESDYERGRREMREELERERR